MPLIYCSHPRRRRRALARRNRRQHHAHRALRDRGEAGPNWPRVPIDVRESQFLAKLGVTCAIAGSSLSVQHTAVFSRH
eukprot:6209088-Pleurochrysis_carterae.AAC.3